AGRVMSRKKAYSTVSLEEFQDSMSGITAKVTEKTKDESPFAYKNIFEVMELQKDLVEVKYYLKPLINIKG
ncbi:MAG: RtcB family protein, partial [Spirochaetota bacterium]|nr:RtcB family protein [Spirochaetota bacterium]